MKSRQVRRQEARENKTIFTPQYNGQQVKTYEEFFGIGNERFNSKFVTIKEVPEQKETI